MVCFVALSGDSRVFVRMKRLVGSEWLMTERASEGYFKGDEKTRRYVITPASHMRGGGHYKRYDG